MKDLVRLPDRFLYVLPRVLLLSLFLAYVAFMLFSSFAWFKPFEAAVHDWFLRLAAFVGKLARGF